MPAGLSKIRQIANDAAARQAAYDAAGPGVRFFKVDNGQKATVRFLEQGDDVKFFWTHQLPKRPGQQYGDSVLCLDQEDNGNPCPGCARQKNRSARVVINVIWFNAPRFEREPGQDGRPGKVRRDPATQAPIINGVEDCVATWNLSQTVGGRLDVLHSNALQAGKGGLMLGIYQVLRRGTGKNTAYDIDLDPAIGYRDPTPAEMELYTSKPDPRGAMRELSYGDMERAYSGGSGPVGQPSAAGAFAAAAGDVQQRGAFGGAPVQVQQPAGVNTGVFGQQ